MLDMKRRDFITLLGGAAASWPLTARAQQPAMPVVGVLSAEWPNAVTADRLRAFHEHELVPTATIIAGLVNPTNPLGAEIETRDLQAAARTLGLTLHVLHASSEQEIDTAFMTLVQLRAGALVIGTDALFNSLSEQLAVLTLRHAVPAIYQYREFVLSGGLASFGTTVVDTYRPLGVYTGRILKGEKPADLPVQQATKLHLIINMKTANALGITVPLPLVGRADEVIE